MQRLRGKQWSTTAAQLCAESCGNHPIGGSSSAESCGISPLGGSSRLCDCLAEGGYVLSHKSGRNAWPNEIYAHRQIERLEYRYLYRFLSTVRCLYPELTSPKATATRYIFIAFDTPSQCCGTGMFLPGSGSDHFLIPDPGSGTKHFFQPGSNMKSEWSNLIFSCFL
jgi:hypothetical protein